MVLHGIRIVCLSMDGKERLCLAQISNTLLKDYSYNEIHNRRVALGITCVQCTPVQVIVKAYILSWVAYKTSSRGCSRFEFQVPQLNLKFRPFEIVESYNAMTSYGCHRWSPVCGVLTTTIVSIGLANMTLLYLDRISNGLFLVV